ncbi:sulfotransferase family protein [Allosphingosinicella deserti]|uniref:sulfotransferase family protein n=1 Tax=Allosphingosinicella deserti TaxID=2116704 RepID=UPI001304EAB6|nr:sulfotransferase family protein [Sphingomonas deserti]
MKIIGAGYPRTGTMSLKKAIEQIGLGPCYHMREVLAGHHQHDHVQLWSRAAHGEAVNWHALFSGYGATVDLPAALFYRQLLDVYPDARILLSVRDERSWYRSVARTIYALRRVRSAGMEDFARLLDDLFWHGVMNGRFEDQDHAIGRYREHVEAVRAYVPADRLLVFDVREGWAPLCAFVGADVPRTPFPHANEGGEFAQYLDLKWSVEDWTTTDGMDESEYRWRLRARMAAFEQRLLDDLAARPVPGVPVVETARSLRPRRHSPPGRHRRPRRTTSRT